MIFLVSSRGDFIFYLRYMRDGTNSGTYDTRTHVRRAQPELCRCGPSYILVVAHLNHTPRRADCSLGK